MSTNGFGSDAYGRIKQRLAKARNVISAGTYTSVDACVLLIEAEAAANDLRLEGVALCGTLRVIEQERQAETERGDKLAERLAYATAEAASVDHCLKANNGDRLEAIARAEKLAAAVEGLRRENENILKLANDRLRGMQTAEADRLKAHDQAREQCEARHRVQNELNVANGRVSNLAAEFERYRHEAMKIGADLRGELVDAQITHVDQIYDLLEAIGSVVGVARDLSTKSVVRPMKCA